MTDVVQPATPAPLDASERSRTGLSAHALQRGIVDHLRYSIGRPSAALTPEHFYRATALAVRDRMQDNRVASYADVARPGPQGDVLPVGRVPDGSAARQQPAQPRHRGRGPQGARAELGLGPRRAAGLRGGAGPRQRRPRPARRVLSRLAGHARTSRPSATASATSSASSTRRSTTAGRSRRPTSGCATATRGRSRSPSELSREARAATPSTTPTTQGRDRVRWVPGAAASRASPTTRRSWATGVQHLQHAALWSAEAVESFDFDAFNTGDYYGAVEDEDHLGEHHQGALPERRAARRQGAAAEQQYFFVSCSLQDMLRIMRRSDGRAAAATSTRSSPCSSTTRIPSIAVAELMRLLVDEHAMLDWDEAWDITWRRFGYTNHTLLPEALESWPLRLFGAVAAAPSRDHLRDQPRASSTRCARSSPATTTRCARMSLIDETRRALRAHGAPRQRRQPRDQRRRGAALRAAEAERAAATSTSCGRRSSATRPTASRRGAAWRWPTRGCASCIDDTIGDGWLTDLDAAAPARALRRRRGVPRAMARRSSSANKDAARRDCIQRRTGIERRSRRRCSTCRSSASTSTSAST